MRISKIDSYENPYDANDKYQAGIIKLTGVKITPKNICKDINNGTRKAIVNEKPLISKTLQLVRARS